LQTGDNPIWVANSSIQGYDPGVHGPVENGDTFSDKHIKSVVIKANSPKLDPEPSVADCGGQPPFDNCPTELPGDQGPNTPCTKGPDTRDISDSEMNCVNGFRSRTGVVTTTYVYDEPTDSWVAQTPTTTWSEWSAWRALTPGERAQLKCDQPPSPIIENISDSEMTCALGYRSRSGTITKEYVWSGSAWVLEPSSGWVTSWGAWSAYRPLTPAERQQLACDTPPPPPPPPTTDVCPNLEGNQATVPAGLVKDQLGNCVPPPPPPTTDVCPNIEGDQAEVPDGYELVNGECAEIAGEEVIVPKPKPDEKPTVKGVQTVAPPAAAPTAVAAGLGAPASSPLQTIAQMLVAGGMLLLMAGAWIGLGRRGSGTHAA
jgi:hypothetical protein